ncbi:hypothetical protein POM88_031058 [Heracleum sosnowskyi]|uniref:PB1-like domain-containing protein n=1 Tax=Heracleum sosnowskyi TaxID=360622 RepID=A0AAD8MGA5_9APIA|nr:hypothetical protein POM88_031058 [Heracleum sosnowskyi]
MDNIIVKIHHGGEFQSKQGIYYYKGGTVDTLYDVDLNAFTLDRCLEYLQEAGYGNELKLYYNKPGSRNKDGYKLIWNKDCVEKIREDAKFVSQIMLYVDHCAEEKGKNVVDELNFGDDGTELDDPDFEEEEYNDSDHDITGKDVGVESDIDEELEEIRERKRMLKKGGLIL